MIRFDLQGRPSVLLAAFFVFSCGLVRLAAAEQPAAKPEVFIYYANETSPEGDEAKSWDTIIDWLASSDNPKVSKIAGQLRRDREQFCAVVDEDLAKLRENLPTSLFQDTPPSPPVPLPRPSAIVPGEGSSGTALPRSSAVVPGEGTSSLAGTAVFTNRLARRGKYLLMRPGSAGLEETTVELPHFENLIYAASPLATAESLGICLREVTRQFDPTRHAFVLHTKSHGNAKMAMTPRLIVRAEQTNREELLAVAAGELSDENLPRWADRLGTTKDEYFATLKQLGDEQQMQFALVFMEACKGTLPEDLKVWPPRNIGRLYMSGPEGADYRNINYAAVLADCSASKPLSQVLDAALAKKFFILVRAEPPSWTSSKPLRLLLWWLPLAAFLAWVGYRYFRRKNRTQSSSNPETG